MTIDSRTWERATGTWHSTPLAPDRVKPRGELAERLDRAGRRLLLDDVYTPEWLLSDITFSCDPTPFNDWYHSHEWTWYADVSGRYLNALVSFAPYAGGMPARGRDLAAKILENQAADGHFGPDRPLETCDRSQASGSAWMLLALPRYFALTGDERALAGAKRLAQWYTAATPHWLNPDIRNAGTALGSNALTYSNFTHCLDGLAALWTVDPQDSWLDLARRIAGAVRPYEQEVHSHHFLSTLRGMLDWHERTGESCFLDQVLIEHEQILQHGMLDTWGVPEIFSRPQSDEGCSEVDWVLLNLKLFACTGRREFLTVAERCLYSHFFMNQTPFGGFGTWCGFHSTIGPMPSGAVGRYKEAYWCCSMHGVFGLAEIARHAYTLRRDGAVSVNLFIGSEATIPTASGTVTVSQSGVGYPGPGTTELTVEVPEGDDVRLSLQLPRHTQLRQARLNGQALEYGPNVPDALEVTVSGGCANRVELDFQMSVRSEPSRQPGVFGDRRTLWYGPMALGTNACLSCIQYSIDDGILADLAPIPPWRENGFSSEVQFALPATDAPDYVHTRTRREVRLYPLAACGHRRLSFMTYLF
jgi:hypothetical protein